MFLYEFVSNYDRRILFFDSSNDTFYYNGVNISIDSSQGELVNINGQRIYHLGGFNRNVVI